MTNLFNGCYCSKLSVHPTNWNQAGASVKEDWYIQYYFYDPTVTNKDTGKIRPKFCIVKGMNAFKTLAERREITKDLMAQEIDLLQVRGFNPITKQFMATPDEIFETDINPSTLFISALRQALEKLSVVPKVKKGIRLIINGVEKAAIQLRYDSISIGSISRKHLVRILERCSKNSKRWSNNRYNCYRGYLMMLFKALVVEEAAAVNHLRDIPKMDVQIKLKNVLTREQRKLIDEHLSKEFFDYRQFVNIFFHSGGRKTELFQLKPPMVDLQNQQYRCIVKKGRTYREVLRTIKTIALPFWEHFLQNCPDDHYLFGTRFKPGLIPMGEEMPSLYWKRYVKNSIEKGGLGIKIDFNKLRHLNSTEVVDSLDEQAAAKLNGHTGTAMVVGIYDVRQKERQHERLKNVANGFV